MAPADSFHSDFSISNRIPYRVSLCASTVGKTSARHLPILTHLPTRMLPMINLQRIRPRLHQPLIPLGIPSLPLPKILRASPHRLKNAIRPQPLQRRLNLLALETLEPAAQVLEVFGLDFGAGGAVGVVLGFGAEDVAFDALAEAVHAAFFLGLAGGEGGGGGAAGGGFGADEGDVGVF